jgi:hypothetical protein
VVGPTRSFVGGQTDVVGSSRRQGGVNFREWVSGRGFTTVELANAESAPEPTQIHLRSSQAPVAFDLRQVVAALRITAEIARSSDLTINICKGARRL